MDEVSAPWTDWPEYGLYVKISTHHGEHPDEPLTLAPDEVALLAAVGLNAHIMGAYMRASERRRAGAGRRGDDDESEGHRLTREILSDPEALAEIRAAEEEIARGDVVHGVEAVRALRDQKARRLWREAAERADPEKVARMMAHAEAQAASYREPAGDGRPGAGHRVKLSDLPTATEIREQDMRDDPEYRRAFEECADDG